MSGQDRSAVATTLEMCGASPSKLLANAHPLIAEPYIDYPSTPFAQLSGSHLPGLIQISNLQYDLAKTDYSALAFDFAALYSNDTDKSRRKGNGLWAGLFGALSPNEDFVETFKMGVLTDKKANGGYPITSMPIYFTDPFTTPPSIMKRDVFRDIAKAKKKVFGHKLSCVQ